jgi:hypothetical protein
MHEPHRVFSALLSTCLSAHYTGSTVSLSETPGDRRIGQRCTRKLAERLEAVLDAWLPGVTATEPETIGIAIACGEDIA